MELESEASLWEQQAQEWGGHLQSWLREGDAAGSAQTLPTLKDSASSNV